MTEPTWGLEACYQILGIKPEEATESSVKSAYRRLSLKHHPDKSKDEFADRKFKLVRLSYEWVMQDLKNQGLTNKKTKTYFSIPGNSAYNQVWDKALHSEEFENWDEKNPHLSKALYGGAKGSGHDIVLSEGMGYFDKQGFWHDHEYEKPKELPQIKLLDILDTYKKNERKKDEKKSKKPKTFKGSKSPLAKRRKKRKNK